MRLKSILGFLIPLDRIVTNASAEARSLSARWDVPQANKQGLFDAGGGEMLPLHEDLRDRQGRYIQTAPDEHGRQYRVAGRMLAEDLGAGSSSSATPLLLGLFSMLSMLTVMLPSGLRILTGLAALCVLALIGPATGKMKWMGLAVIFAFVLPLAGAGGASGFGPIMRGGMVPMAGAAGLVAIIAFVMAGMAGVRSVLFSILGIVIVLAASAAVPPSLAPVIMALPGALLPIIWAVSERRERVIRLLLQGRVASGEDAGIAHSHIPARLTQAKNAARDTSPVFTFGEATGELRTRGDGFAPDAGLPIAMSLRDLSTHAICFGETNSGKTSTFLRPLIAALMRARLKGERIGMLIADGKGALAGEFVGMLDYTGLNPRHEVVSLYEGLSAGDVARQHEENNLAGATGNDKTWQSMAAEVSRPSAYMLEALARHRITDTRTGEPWRWCLLHHDRLGKMFLAGEEALGELESLWGQLNEKEGPFDGLLMEAYLYSTRTVQAMADVTRGSVLSNWQMWFGPYTGHVDLLRWAAADHGASVEGCLHGEVVGLDINGSLYGQHSAALVTKFLKARVIAELQRRAGVPDGDWRKADPTATPCFLIVDEFQDVYTPADAELIPKSRSLGGHYVVATQTLESLLQAGKSEHATKAMLASILSRFALKTSPLTMQWLQEGVGMGKVPHYQSGGTQIEFVRSVDKAYRGPLWDASHPLAGPIAVWRRMVGGMRFADPRTDARLGKANVSVSTLLDQGLVLAHEWKEEPILELSRFSALTADQGTAFASVRRGSVVRRDFIRVVDPLNAIPDDLRDPSHTGKRRDLAAEDAQAARQKTEAMEAAGPSTQELQQEEEAQADFTALLDAIRNPTPHDEVSP